ncbi:hypothetical protein JRO89_XS04G0218200 [Xanthoceras sorbifolium]|uniref:NAC domain-containing protein n=1 Tax=Xanthoceras sorbifolium TaxID=99658 RepID=A0ABQ8I6D5_9ROSI|nr:hypothetical protein JRO89_XS04G0218200 [Xanthoceras sorbifolium]
MDIGPLYYIGPAFGPTGKTYWVVGKVSLNSNINNKDITTNNISHLIGSTPASASNILKVENCNDYGNSSTDFNANPKSERDMFYHQNLDPEGIILDPISFQVPFPRLMEVSDHSTSAHKIIDYSKSSSQEASSLSISSSSPLTLESNYVSWSANNGNAEEEASLLDFMSFESPYGFLQGFDQFPENKQ